MAMPPAPGAPLPAPGAPPPGPAASIVGGEMLAMQQIYDNISLPCKPWPLYTSTLYHSIFPTASNRQVSNRRNTIPVKGPRIFSIYHAYFTTLGPFYREMYVNVSN